MSRARLRRVLIDVATAASSLALLGSALARNTAGIMFAGVLLLGCIIAQGIENRLSRPAVPQVPLDDAYYAQPLRRRVLARLLGTTARPRAEDNDGDAPR